MRARGTPDARRIRSLVRKVKKHTSVVTTNTPTTSGVPHAMVLTACFERPPAGEPLLPADIADLRINSPNRGKRHLPQLGARTSRQDRRLGPYETGVVVIAIGARPGKPGKLRTRQSDRTPIASTASRLASVTIAIRPSS